MVAKSDNLAIYDRILVKQSTATELLFKWILPVTTLSAYVYANTIFFNTHFS